MAQFVPELPSFAHPHLEQQILDQSNANNATEEKLHHNDLFTNIQPSTWTKYYDNSFTVELNQKEIFQLYESTVNYTHNSSVADILILLLHGGGQSSLSWSLAAKSLQLKLSQISQKKYSILAMDLRGHGNTQIKQNNRDLSIETLTNDVEKVLQAIYCRKKIPIPPMIIAGHSLGSCIAVHFAKNISVSTSVTLIGCICVDLVEGSALESMDFISSVVKTRPNNFPSLSTAIEWSIRSGMLQNIESACVSIPPQLQYIPDKNQYSWKTDLLASREYWSDWFTGLSERFLGLTCPKLLILADSDRLDKTMMIAQMQGKLQVELVGNCGHQIQEDQPSNTANIIVQFIVKHKIEKKLNMLQIMQQANTALLISNNLES
jgi:pimeloyl-ACP methyl ester carboxylesterase